MVDEPLGGDAPDSEWLYCQKESARIPAANPRCRHPSSRCAFRELCEVIEAVRKKR
jgi:hypothetical protein